MFKIRKSLILIAAGAAMTAMTLQAAQAALLTTSGIWQSVTPPGVEQLGGTGTSTLSWGEPLNQANKPRILLVYKQYLAVSSQYRRY